MAAEFSALLAGSDSRLLRAVAQLGFTTATDVQAAALPPALEGRDVIVRARTGSGKTLAYALPIVDRILRSRSAASTSTADLGRHATRALILVPTRELAEQVATQVRTLVTALGAAHELVTVCNVAGSAQGVKGKATGGSEKMQRFVAERPAALTSQIAAGRPPRRRGRHALARAHSRALWRALAGGARDARRRRGRPHPHLRQLGGRYSRAPHRR